MNIGTRRRRDKKRQFIKRCTGQGYGKSHDRQNPDRTWYKEIVDYEHTKTL